MLPGLDQRLVAARPDLAAAHLHGKVEAARFVEGQPMQVSAGVVALRRAPEDDAEMLSQALHGERFTVYEERDGYGWGQCQDDGYVGWADMAALSAPVQMPSHRVAALRSYMFSEPDIKSAPLYLVSENALVHVEERSATLARCARAGWIAERHLAPLSTRSDDFLAEVVKYVGTPYLWGGRESLGLDCSGLVMAAALACGMACPRDSDMQRKWLGQSIGEPFVPERFAAGDVLCWRGHVGVVGAAVDTLVHANAHYMATIEEPLLPALGRIAQSSGPILDVRRLDLTRHRTAPTPWRAGLASA